MMSGARNAASSMFKWLWRNDPSLINRLLDDVPPEVELSDYRRLPSPGSESPSGLLNGEGLNLELIADLDLFFERLYNYYCEKGLCCIITKWVVEILTVIFVVCCIGFFLLVVNWHALGELKCGIEAFEWGNKTCDLAEAINQHPLVPFTFTKGIILGSMVILTIYGLFNFLKFIVQFRNTVEIRDFYYNSLNVTDREIQTTPWPEILDKVVQLQRSQQLCVVKDLSAHDVTMRIMRKDNYLIGMLNKGVLAFPVPWWVPGAGPAVTSRSNGSKNRLVLTKTLEWTLNWFVFQSMFDSNFCLRSDFVTSPSSLRKRLIVVGIVIFLISPCLVIFMLVYLFLRHAEQFYNHPSIASSRRWSNLSKWIFREFNEVDHLFRHRISNSVIHASNYLKQFPSPLVSIIAKFVSFVSGGFAAVLIIIAFLDESLLEGHIFGRNLLWYAAVFGAVTAISRAAVSDELQVLDPEGAMGLVIQHTHYMPKRWRGKENTDSVRTDFETLFQYTGTMLLEEMVSILLTPYLLIFVVPERVDDILRFVSDFTVHVEGVGHVCSLSVFDFQNHGNTKYGSPYEAPKERRSSQGKMEKSFLSFQTAYPKWEPSDQGRQFLSTLFTFEEKMYREAHRAAQQLTSGFRRQSEIIRRFLSRDALHNNEGTRTIGYQHSGSLWLRNSDQRTHPYLLDWYYISRPLHAQDDSKDLPSPTSEMAFEPPQYLWRPHDKLHDTIEEDENWDLPLSHRVQSHLEASTSTPLFRDSVLQNRNTKGHTVNHWWSRSGVQPSGPQTSFLEPPSFAHHNFSHHNDDVSERSAGFEEGDGIVDMGWNTHNPLSRTTCVDDSDKDEFHLPFADEGPLKSLNVRIIPRSNDPIE